MNSHIRAGIMGIDSEEHDSVLCNAIFRLISIIQFSASLHSLYYPVPCIEGATQICHY